MSRTTPYTYYVCPCSEERNAHDHVTRTGDEAQEEAFNPHDPRAAYALNSFDHLLFCDDCNQIRCNRCISEEILNWYCPNCLFETHSTGVRADGNRCSRNCYNCPICMSTAIVVRSQGKDEDEENYILACQHCNWTSLQIGLQFNKPNKITEQINQIRRAWTDAEAVKIDPTRFAHNDRFGKLLGFYREQLADANDLPGRTGSGAYGSPANLARIIHMYGGLAHKSLAKAQDRSRSMREADKDEGLVQTSMEDSEDDLIARLVGSSFEQTASRWQQDAAPVNQGSRFSEALWPSPTRLRTRRGKRCRQCRQFVVRPETKTTSWRYKIRILGRNHIPRLDMKPFGVAASSQHPSFVLRDDVPVIKTSLQPFQTYQYLLTLRNPIFEPVKITLGTPGVTPGPMQSRVTILCPSFTMGPAGDVWEDALGSSTSAMGDGSRKAAMASLTGGADAERQPEAGKVWEQTRNSTTVVVEVILGALPEALQTSSDPQVLEIPISVRAEWMADIPDEQAQKGKTELKELQYWCVIGVGHIARSSV